MENYNIRGMDNNKATRKQRDAIPTALYRVYCLDNNSPFYNFNSSNELTFWVINFNNSPQPIKFIVRKVTKSNRINSYIFDSDKNKDFTKSLAIELFQCLNKKDKYKDLSYKLNGNVWEDNSNSNLKLFCFSCERLSCTTDSITFKKSLNEYVKLKDVESKKNWIGGLRKWIDCYKEDMKKIFNPQYIKDLLLLFNNKDLSHGNKFGEQYFDKEDKKIKTRYKKPELKNLTDKDFNSLCDNIYKKVDYIYKFLEIEGYFKKK